MNDSNYFLALYKDRPEDTWYNVCFVNNGEDEIRYLKMQSLESCYNDGIGHTAELMSEYVNIPPGEYLFLEKIGLLEEIDGEYRYSFTFEKERESVRLGCAFNGSDFSEGPQEARVLVVNEM